MQKDLSKTKLTIKKLLADRIGTEVEDIKDDDFLSDDLHMTAGDISDFLHSIQEKYEFEFDDIPGVETVQDLIDEISQNLEL